MHAALLYLNTMKSIKNLKLAFTFIGTLIGAGFASGREIALYFADTSPLSPLLGGVFCGLFCFVFVELGRISQGDILGRFFNKISSFTIAIIKISNIIIFCVMLAACEFIIKNLFDINGGTIISAVLVLSLIYFGVEKLKLLNFLAVPLLVGLIVYIYIAAKPEVPEFNSFYFYQPIFYAGMNILSGGFLISKLAKGINAKDSLKISLIVAVVLSALLVIIYLTIQDAFELTMPLLNRANELGLNAAASVALYLSVFTTLAGSLYIVVENNLKKALLVGSIGLVLSFAGFQKLTNWFYPIIGYAGFALTLYGAFILIFRRPNLEFLSS